MNSNYFFFLIEGKAELTTIRIENSEENQYYNRIRNR